MSRKFQRGVSIVVSEDWYMSCYAVISCPRLFDNIVSKYLRTKTRPNIHGIRQLPNLDKRFLKYADTTSIVVTAVTTNFFVTVNVLIDTFKLVVI